jgi:hypothetical protein
MLCMEPIYGYEPTPRARSLVLYLSIQVRENGGDVQVIISYKPGSRLDGHRFWEAGFVRLQVPKWPIGSLAVWGQKARSFTQNPPKTQSGHL